MGTRILVTGGDGFVGRPLVRLLVRQGYDVVALSRRPRKSADVQWLAGDLLDLGQHRRLLDEARAAQLVHLAWYVEHGLFWAAPENTTWTAASLAFLSAFRAAGGTRVLCAGSCAEYDWTRADDRAWAENDPCRPATAYGAAKLLLLQRGVADAALSGLSLAWARLFLIFGEGENPARLIPSMIHALLKRRPLELGPGMRVRDFMATADVAEALLTVMRSELTGPVNIATGAATSLAALGEMLAKITAAPSSLLRFGARSGGNEPPHMVADIARLRNAGFAGGALLSQRLSEYVGQWPK